MRQLFIIIGFMLAGVAAQAKDQRFEGYIDVTGQGKLQIIWNVSTDDAGVLKSLTMDIPQQGGVAIPASKAAWNGDQLDVEFAMLGASFSGAKTADGIAGTFSQAGQNFAFMVREVAVVDTPKVQPAKELVFVGPSRELVIPAGDISPINGTLYLPAGDGPHPVVVLISGSGPQDRRAMVVPRFEIFTQFAAHLTAQGVAVFAYDDRDFDKGPTFTEHTSLDHARDAATALAYLKTLPEIDASRTAYLGHSEGGQNQAIAHARFEPASHMVSVAGTSVDLGTVLVHQKAIQAKVAGAADAMVATQSASLTKMVEASKAHADAAARDTALERVMDEIGLPEAARPQNKAFFNTRWMHWALNFDPATDWGQVRVPVLAIFGSKDLQVDPAQNIPPLRQALADNSDVTITTLDGLNHLLQKANTGLGNEYMTLPPEIDPAALTAISDWLTAQWGL